MVVLSPDSTCAECLRRFTSDGRDGGHLCHACWTELKTAAKIQAGRRGRPTVAFGMKKLERTRGLGHSIGFAPRVGVAPERGPRPARASAGGEKVGSRVLIVEDHEGIRDTMAAILREEGYVVLRAADGVEALDKLRGHEIDVMLLDLRLPRLDGRTMLEGLETPPAVVVCSAFQDSEEAEIRERFASVVVDCLRKPVPPKRLIEATAAAASQGRAG